MLRMYECNWCGTRQVKDDSSVEVVPNKGRMAFKLEGTCYKNCRKRIGKFKPIMHPMRRDPNGDWCRLPSHMVRTRVPRLDKVVPVTMATY